MKKNATAGLLLLLLAVVLCILDTPPSLVQGHPTRFRVLLVVDALLVAVLAVGFARAVAEVALGGGTGRERLAAGLSLLPLPLFVAYHLMWPNWLVQTAYKLLVALQLAWGMPTPGAH